MVSFRNGNFRNGKEIFEMVIFEMVIFEMEKNLLKYVYLLFFKVN